MGIAENGMRGPPRIDGALLVMDASAFRRLHDMSRGYLLACAMRVMRNRELAEDVLQESFSTIWNSARQYDPSRSAPMTWMAAIVRNKAIDCLRREGEHWRMCEFGDGALDAAPDLAPTPEEDCERRQLVESARRSIGALRDGQRQAMELVYWRGLSHPEAACVLGQPLGSVKTLVRRGLFQVRTDMGEAPPAPARREPAFGAMSAPAPRR